MNQVKFFRKFLNRKSGRELLKPFKGKIVNITGSTYITDKGKVIRRNHLAVNETMFFRQTSNAYQEGAKAPHCVFVVLHIAGRYSTLKAN